jgi:hypothetical protein
VEKGKKSRPASGRPKEKEGNMKKLEILFVALVKILEKKLKQFLTSHNSNLPVSIYPLEGN